VKRLVKVREGDNEARRKKSAASEKEGLIFLSGVYLRCSEPGGGGGGRAEGVGWPTGKTHESFSALKEHILYKKKRGFR